MINVITNCTLKSISAQFKRLNLLVTECWYTARRLDALHFFLWGTSALNICYSVSTARCGIRLYGDIPEPHKTKPDRFRPFRLHVDGASVWPYVCVARIFSKHAIANIVFTLLKYEEYILLNNTYFIY